MKTTIKGKEINLFDMAGVSAFYTKTIADYLSNGYIFYVGAGRGSQGEEAKVVLTNDSGKSALVIYVDKQSCWYENNGTISIFVKKFENVRQDSTLWLQRGELISEKTFWKISRNSKEVYCESESDFNLIHEVQEIRSQERYEIIKSHRKEIKSETYKKLALKLLKKEKGYKSKTLKDISSMERIENRLEIRVNKTNSQFCDIVTIYINHSE